ncbi:Uma2 family endonuclease [Actinoplanes sp. NBC_00393]|uniref:Uma2 family endonuclease n=1 Tax=Actinoplanes sp. NBC_00393 TaxID=2975953 RepID=UPI002E22C9EE
MSLDELLKSGGPWTEQEFLALDKTATRVELIDGSILVSPAPHRRHQDISARLWMSLFAPAQAAGLSARQAVNVRLGPQTIVIPDLVVETARDGGVVEDASGVVLACEITSPSNVMTDRIGKKLFYADARIPWYLLVEPDFADYTTVSLHLFRLEGKKYTVHAVARPGETLSSAEPFPFKIHTSDLSDF